MDDRQGNSTRKMSQAANIYMVYLCTLHSKKTIMPKQTLPKCFAGSYETASYAVPENGTINECIRLTHITQETRNAQSQNSKIKQNWQGKL